MVVFALAFSASKVCCFLDENIIRKDDNCHLNFKIDIVLLKSVDRISCEKSLFKKKIKMEKKTKTNKKILIFLINSKDVQVIT